MGAWWISSWDETRSFANSRGILNIKRSHLKRNFRATELAICGFRAHYRILEGNGIYIRVYKYTSAARLDANYFVSTCSAAPPPSCWWRRARTCARRYKLLRDGEQILVETSVRKWGCGGGLIRSFKWKHLVPLGRSSAWCPREWNFWRMACRKEETGEKFRLSRVFRDWKDYYRSPRMACKTHLYLINRFDVYLSWYFFKLILLRRVENFPIF